MNYRSRGALAALLVSSALGASLPQSVVAQEPAPTFYADALPLFQKNCAACHKPNGPRVGGITAPMSLLDYTQARAWAPMIRNALVTGYMPPWGAHQRHKGEFKDERYIDEAEKAMLIAWVDGGALEGSPADAANMAQASDANMPESGWWIGDPDLIVQFERPVEVEDSIEDWQPTIQMPVPEGAHTAPRWISIWSNWRALRARGLFRARSPGSMCNQGRSMCRAVRPSPMTLPRSISASTAECLPCPALPTMRCRSSRWPRLHLPGMPTALAPARPAWR